MEGKDKTNLTTLCTVFKKLPKDEQKKLVWIAQGILIGSQASANGAR